MSDDLTTIGNVFGIAILVCFVCGLPAVVVGGLTYSALVVTPRRQAAEKQLIEQLRLQPDPRLKYRYWGTYQDHAYYIHLAWAAIGVEVLMQEPLRGYARVRRRYVSKQEGFETAFKARQHTERLSPAARVALLAFARKRGGGLFLEGLPIHPAPEPPAEGKVRLEHTPRSRSELTPDGVRVILDDLIEVARVIETTTAPPH